jgi:hypothetical protein
MITTHQSEKVFLPMDILFLLLQYKTLAKVQLPEKNAKAKVRDAWNVANKTFAQKKRFDCVLAAKVDCRSESHQLE